MNDTIFNFCLGNLIWNKYLQSVIEQFMLTLVIKGLKNNERDSGRESERGSDIQGKKYEKVKKKRLCNDSEVHCGHTTQLVVPFNVTLKYGESSFFIRFP